MAKPDWSLAPRWAKFLAQDDDRDWYWFENRPLWNGQDGSWYDATDGRCIEHVQHMRESRVDNGTLEERP